MKKALIRIPWFYILLCIFPLLFLWANNISDIYSSVVILPFLFTIAASVVLFGILYAILRNIEKAALIGALFLVGFFSYGHIYSEMQIIPALKILAHHRTLIPLYLIIFGLSTWGILLIKKYGRIIYYLNLVSIILILIQAVQICYFYIGTFYAARHQVTTQPGLTIATDRKDLPDIYLIVLDAYTREDAMKQDLGFDNRQFINQLEQMGFYVARCSRANYNFTLASVAATLNMKYIPQAYKNHFAGAFWTIIKNNDLRHQLESLGYKTVSFKGDDPRVVFDDADVLFTVNGPVIGFTSLSGFETLYIQSTALIILQDLDAKIHIFQPFALNTTSQKTSSVDFSGMGPNNHGLIKAHVDAQLYFLNKLQDVPAIAGPKLTYVHITMPHFPYVFKPDGKMQTDPGFYSAKNGDAVNKQFETLGYLSNVQYINKRIIPILQTIIKESKTPPIIVLMGDHGLRQNNRYTNLNAYYLPNGDKGLYETITPVNSFRVILNEYFGANYPLLPDVSYSGDNVVVHEAYTDCIP